MAKKKKISKPFVWLIIFVSALLLVFSYNAFSYDIFNYIFDAKIFTHYHQNPYLQKALDYPGDPMLSFMRWTHRVYLSTYIFVRKALPSQSCILLWPGYGEGSPVLQQCLQLLFVAPHRQRRRNRQEA